MVYLSNFYKLWRNIQIRNLVQVSCCDNFNAACKLAAESSSIGQQTVTHSLVETVETELL